MRLVLLLVGLAGVGVSAAACGGGTVDMGNSSGGSSSGSSGGGVTSSGGSSGIGASSSGSSGIGASSSGSSSGDVSSSSGGSSSGEIGACPPPPYTSACAGVLKGECGAGNQCLPAPDGVCRPSSCDCTDGVTTCTADCAAHLCLPAQCDGDAPSLDECVSDADCEGALRCVPSALAVCRPSSCDCDADAGTWVCTKDCGAYHVCAP